MPPKPSMLGNLSSRIERGILFCDLCFLAIWILSKAQQEHKPCNFLQTRTNPFSPQCCLGKEALLTFTRLSPGLSSEACPQTPFFPVSLDGCFQHDLRHQPQTFILLALVWFGCFPSGPEALEKLHFHALSWPLEVGRAE